MTRNFVEEAKSEVIPNIGQIDRQSRLSLDRAVRAGTISKWRGHWFPHAGAPVGLGPLKVCYGPNEMADYFADWRASWAQS